MRGRGARTPIGASENFDTFVLLLIYHLGQDEPLQSKVSSPASDVFHRKVVSLLSSVGLNRWEAFLTKMHDNIHFGKCREFVSVKVGKYPSVGPSFFSHFRGGGVKETRILV